MIGWSATATDVIPVLDTDVELLIGWSSQVVFGTRTNVPINTTADVWQGTALTRPLPLAAKAMSVRSSDNVGDNAPNVKLVGVTFIDAAGDWRTSDLLLLTGTTPVPITYKPDQILVTQGAQPTLPEVGVSVPASIFRVQDIAVFSANGATEAAPRVTNTGILRVVDTATNTVVYDYVPAGTGRGRSAAFHVPRGYSARLSKAEVGTSRGTGIVSIAATFGLGTSFQILPLTPLNDATVIFPGDPATTPIVERSDVQAIILSQSNSIDVTAIMHFRLKPLAPLPP